MFFLFLVSACVASFLNVVIVRWPQGKSVVTPRSHCPHCKKTIPIHDLIPIVSWILRRGRARCCGQKISPRYLVIELIGAMVLPLAWWFLKDIGEAVAISVVIWSYIVLSAIDLETFLLPDVITLPLIPYCWFVSAVVFKNLPPLGALVGGFLGFGFFWLIAALYEKWRGKMGMGGGDIKLIGSIGMLTGIEGVVFVIGAASLAGAIFGIILMKIFRRDNRVPFGPFLCAATVLYLFVGDIFWKWYWGMNAIQIP